jgi:low affinity Fe/Cu permease
MPSDEDGHLGWFDRFADLVASFTSRAWFFTLCVLLVVLWAPLYFVLGSVDTWQLIINTATTIVTFLLVALLQNTQKRGDDAVHQKLNALAQYLVSDGGSRASDELRQAIGIERRESST